MFKREDIEPSHFERAGTYHPSSGVSSGAVLAPVNGALQNRRFDIPAGRSTVGRNSTNDIVIDDESVSLVHARLFQKGNEWWVLNLLSTNGTYVNDTEVTDALLHDGDHVRFGQAEFVFRKPAQAVRPRFSWLRSLRTRLLSVFG